MILKTCYNKVKECRYLVTEPEKQFNDQSFKSLVYLTDIENKLPPSIFRKLKDLNKVVG